LQLEVLEDRLSPAVLTVNTTADNTTDTSVLTLRDAITLANSAGDPTALGQSSMPAGWASQIDTTNPFGSSDTIQFDIPATDAGHVYYQDDSGSGQKNGTVNPSNVVHTTAADDNTIADIDPDWPHSWWSITPIPPLPSITDAVDLNGYSQLGASRNTLTIGDNAVLKIVLDGRHYGLSVYPLAIDGGSCTVRGFVIDNYTLSDAGLWLRGGGNNLVVGNFIGIDVSGSTAAGNVSGIAIQSTGNTIGGTSPCDRNIISGNDGDADILLQNDGNLIQGNYIGTDKNGTSALTFSTIGDTPGIWISGDHNTVGGTAPGTGNIIAVSSASGLLVGGAGNSIRGNSIFGNGGLGIDLNGSGVPIVNDLQGHVGPNNFQNYPTLNSATSSSTSTHVTGTFTEAVEPNATITLDFYANATPDPTKDSNGVSGYGRGQTYLGSRTVYTDNTGNVSFDADFAVGNLAGQWVSATATDQSGNTSEFSLDVQATSAPSQTFAQNLPSSLPQSSVPVSLNSMTIQADPTTIADVLNGLSSSNLGPTVTQVAVNVNLAPGKYSNLTVNIPTGLTLNIVGGPNVTIDPAQPAFTVAGGNVYVSNVTFTESGDAPTILVTGSSLALRNDIIQESTAFTNAAIAITGGTLDLGTSASPGNNIINVNGTGQFVQNTTANAISAVGDTFESDGTVLPAPLLSFTSLAASVNPSILNQSVTLTASVRPNGSSTTPTGSVDIFDTTTNTDLGSVILSGGSASLSTSALAVGNHVIRAGYSGDSNFLPSLAVLTQQVHYTFSGFLAPLNQGLAFAAGRTVPIKFQLTDYNKTFITSLSAVTALQVVYPDNSTHAISGLLYDSTANQFTANWSTKGLSAGSYTISLSLLDGITYTVTIQITASHASAGLTTDAAGGTGTAPGGLLGGDIDLYVDNTNGDLTADELARIQDGVTTVDAVTEPYGVAVREVSDPTLADVTLNMNTTSAVGGYADGVLGCTTDAGQITVITGWNFYSGSDASQIGAMQYDFETVVTHELGHALGLGHRTDSASVMYATLNANMVNRALTPADLNVPDSDTTGACGLHAAAVPAIAAGITNPVASAALSRSIGAAFLSTDAVRSLLFALTAAELPRGFVTASQPGTAPSAAACDSVFAAVEADGLSNPAFALPVAKGSPVYAAQSVREGDDALFEVPMFPNLGQNGQGCGADGSASDPADPSILYDAGAPSWLDG
jgi:hypothetical protein